MSPRLRLTLMLLLTFLAGVGTHYAASRAGNVGRDPKLLPPIDTVNWWPKMDSARVAAIAKAAYKSEFYGVDSLAVDSMRYGRIGYTVALSEVPPMMGGNARVRVSNAGGACVLDFDQ